MESTLCPKLRKILFGENKMPTPRQLERILELAKLADPRTRCMIELFYYTGCRVSELCGLRPDHICNIHNLVVLKTLKQRAKEAPIRAVEVPADFIKRLLALPVLKTGRLFRSRWTVLRRVREVTKQAGIIGAAGTTRAFRHRFITRCDQVGLSKTLSKALVGHRTDSAHSIYIHPNQLSDEAEAEIKSKLPQIWKTGQATDPQAQPIYEASRSILTPASDQHRFVSNGSDCRSIVFEDAVQPFFLVPAFMISNANQTPYHGRCV